jgi:hypothetical protein
VLAAALAWLGPPGADLAAHLYQRWVLIHDGFTLWNNFWYAGRYSFVTYSVLYYPLAALLGIRLLAVATISAAALAFAVLVWREWGPATRWSSRTFAVVWAGIVLSAAFPFALGAALALFALLELQTHRRLWFAVLALLTVAASPVAFLFLGIVIVGVGASRRVDRGLALEVVGILCAIALLELVLQRSFPDDGVYRFSRGELAGVLVFCALGTVLTWNVERARSIRLLFVVYAAATVAAYIVPSGIGENIARLRYLAIPLTVLVLSLRDWCPRVVSALVLALAISWNVSPLAFNVLKAREDVSDDQAYWAPAIDYLHRHLTPSYRVEAVDTTGHWPAFYLARAGIPLARGWFRQDDFPLNAVLYERLDPRAYVDWLHRLGVRYVVLANVPQDYSARAEATLLRQPSSPLRAVLRTPRLTVYEVPNAVPIVSGPAPARIESLTQSRIVLELGAAGTYRLAVRHSPYWTPSFGCVATRSDEMMQLRVSHPGRVVLTFDVEPMQALRTLVGQRPEVCADEK